MKDFRTRISTDHGVALSDRDILDCLTLRDLPADLLKTLEEVLSLFPSPKPAASPPSAEQAVIFTVASN